jgi:uncharacterized membrane protein
MFRYVLYISILATVLLTGCDVGSRLVGLQTTNMSSIAMASGYCSGERLIDIHDVSIDGSVVVGKCAMITAPNEQQGFRYSKDVGFEILDSLSGKAINELKVSGDGHVIWGSYYVKDEGSHVFRFTKALGVKHLGTMGKPSISIGGVSADGSVIVGEFSNSLTAYPLLYRAFRYSQSSGLEDLGLLNGDSTIPLGVSPDGSQVVGHVDVGTNSNKAIRSISAHAFSYSKMNGMKNLGTLHPGHDAFATGVSNDGAVVGGIGRFMIGFIVAFYEDSYGFVQLRNGQMQKLSGIGGTPTVIRISSDGTGVAGGFVDAKRDRYVFTARLVSH